jgi:hypothetical protein
MSHPWLASWIGIALIPTCASLAHAESTSVLEHPSLTITAEFGAMVVAGSPHFKMSPGFPDAGIGLGTNLLVEHEWYGLETAAQVTNGGGCTSGGEPSECGAFWMFEIAPRATLFPRSAWSPYAKLPLQLLYGDPRTFSNSGPTTDLVPVWGGRLGVRYRTHRAGFYLEAGASRGFTEQCSQYGCWNQWLVQVSTGASVSWAL